MKKESSFSFHARRKSFRFAAAGIKTFFGAEHNAWLHLAGTVIVIILAIVLPVSAAEAGVLAVAVGMVWAAELFNTVIEKIMDFISTAQHPQIKYIKDLSAAAVLLSALSAAAAGLIIFIPKLFI